MNVKQARPEIMLPKARNIMRMVLTIRSERKTCFRKQSSTGLAEVPAVSVRATETYDCGTDFYMDIVSEERVSLNQRRHSGMREMSRAAGDKRF